ASAELEKGLQDLFWGPVTGIMAIVGSASWLVALVSAAWAWRKRDAPAAAVALLVMSGVLLAIGHIRPSGPLACLCFLIAAAMLELRYRTPAAIASPLMIALPSSSDRCAPVRQRYRTRIALRSIRATLR